MRVAALDLGSNSFLCLIAEGKNGKIEKIISDHVDIVRLGEGVDKNKVFSLSALLRAQNTLENFNKEIITHQVDKVMAAATSAARDATNSSELIKICEKLQIPLQIYSGATEAEVSFLGAVFDQPVNDLLLIVDIGGGSTEFTLGQGGKILKRKSLNVGGVRYFERYIQSYPLSSDKLQVMEEQISKEINILFDELDLLKTIQTAATTFQLLAVAGTPTALAAAELGGFKEDQVHGYRLSLQSLLSWKEKLANSSVSEKIQMGIEEKRADIILVGVCILIQTLQKLNLSDLNVSTKGLRYGVALSLLK